jgi:hypothetical protein
MGILAKAIGRKELKSTSSKRKGTISDIIKFSSVQTHEEKKKSLLLFLENLKQLESKLWGVTIQNLSNGEEVVLEDANHLIYLISRDNTESLKKVLKSKEIKEFTKDIENLREDFLILKKQIKRKENLKNLISNYSIRLVSEENYSKLEKVFLLEKQLNEVIAKQDEELNNLLKNISQIKFPIENKEKLFLDSLVKMRKILSGHMDHHSLWEEEKQGFSNTSNIISSLIKEVKINT